MMCNDSLIVRLLEIKEFFLYHDTVILQQEWKSEQYKLHNSIYLI